MAGDSSRRSALSLYMRGLMLERSARLPDALDAYHEALEHDVESSALHVRLGATQVKLGQVEQAFKSFRRALAIDPANQDAWRWIAMLETSQGRIPEAIQAYEQLVEKGSTDRFVVGTLADLYVLQNQLPKAIALYERIVAEQGSSAQLHFNLGVLYGRLSQFSSAILELSRAVELSPGSVEIRVALALTYELNDQPQQAAAHYEEAIQMDPLNHRLYLHAARLYSDEGQPGKAIAHYETVLDLDPANIEAIASLIRLWMLEKRFDDAQRLLGDKLESLSEPSELYLLLGLLYREAGVGEEAMRAFERAVQLKEDSAQARFYFGAQLERLQQKAGAREQLRRAIELDPAFADALNYLGYMNAEDRIDLAEAKTLVERALEIEPDNGAYVDSLGWVYYQMDEVDAAITHLERAAGLLNTDATIFDHLGDAYFRNGQLGKAEEAWRKALELDRSLEAIQQKLQQLPASPLP